MFPKSRYLLIVILSVLAACGPITTTTPPGESPVTEPPTESPVISTNYFEGFPPEYQDIELSAKFREILETNPESMIVPLPQDQFPLQETIRSIATANEYDLSPFDLNRIIRFPSEQEGDFSYLAVPTSQEFFAKNFSSEDDFASKGVLAGLIYDRYGKYTETPDVFYEVWFFNEKAVLRNYVGEDIVSFDYGEDYSWEERSTFQKTPLVIFIKNGCWGHWSIDGRSGWLVCR